MSDKKSEPNKGTKIFAGIITAVIFIFILSAISGGGEPDTNLSNAPMNEEISPLQENESEEVLDESEKIPAEYKSALNKATSYANTMHMSKQGVYDQLVSEYGEKFTEEEADYAIANLNN